MLRVIISQKATQEQPKMTVSTSKKNVFPSAPSLLSQYHSGWTIYSRKKIGGRGSGQNFLKTPRNF